MASPDFTDPYIDLATGILRNLVGARTTEELSGREADLVALRRLELIEDPPSHPHKAAPVGTWNNQAQASSSGTPPQTNGSESTKPAPTASPKMTTPPRPRITIARGSPSSPYRQSHQHHRTQPLTPTHTKDSYVYDFPL